MLTAAEAVTGAHIKQAIETRDGGTLASFYADDAVMRIVDEENPPSHPREIRGRPAITAFWDDMCGRTMTHKVDTLVAEGDRIAFTQACAYPNGSKVLCSGVVNLKDGRIAEQTMVQAWDH